MANILGVDIVDNNLTGVDIRDSSIFANDIGSQQVASDEVANDSLLQSDIRAGAVTSDEVLDNSLTGADISESSLNLPATTTGTFAGQGGVSLADNGTFAKVTSKSLPAGSYAIAATANVAVRIGGDPGNTEYRDTTCELRGTNGAYIGGGRDRRLYPHVETTTVSISMNGGAQVPAGGGEVGLYCRYQEGGAFSRTADGQMMILKLDGFF